MPRCSALQHESDAGGCDRGADAVGFVTDDGVDVAGRNYLGGGCDYVRQQGLAADFVQHFGMLGFQPGSFARGQDCDGYAGGAVMSLFSAFDPIYREKLAPGRGWLPWLLVLGRVRELPSFARPGKVGHLPLRGLLWGGGAGAAWGLGCQVHQVGGDAVGGVAGDHAGFQVVAEYRDYAQFFDGVQVGDDLIGAFEGVLGFQFRRARECD